MTVPYCTACAKYWAPTSMEPDGTCPRCHRVLDSSPLVAQTTRPYTAADLDLKKLAAGDEDVDPRAPWHFKLLVVALVLYLGWRVVDLFI